MSQLDQTVQVNISRETTAVARAAFNVPCFVSSHTAFSPRTKEYTSLEAVAVDFSTNSSAYIAASRYFGQERRPPKIVIGRRQINSVNVTVASVVVGAVYTITVNGVAMSYTAQSGATQQSIIDGLEAVFGSSPHAGITFTDNTGSFTVSVATAGSAWSFKASSNLSVSQVASPETWTTTLNEVKNSSNAFYGLNTEDHSDVSILEISAWANASNVLYVTSTSSPAVKTSVTTDIASQLKALSYSKVVCLYSGSADSQYPECAWVGDRLPPVAGTAQWSYATLQGVTVDNLTDDEISNIESKNCNYYITIANVPVTKKGKLVNGSAIEETMIVDWTKSRIQERIFYRMVNSLKLPNDNSGLAIIQSDIYSVLQEGVRNTAFASNPAPYVYVPDILDIDPNLRAQGIVTGIKFKARMVIGVIEVVIDGTVVI